MDDIVTRPEFGMGWRQLIAMHAVTGYFGANREMCVFGFIL